jgi:hypothetical protein
MTNRKNYEPMMQWFRYDHLPMSLQEISKGFYQMANHLVETLPSNSERDVALRKLLESKDAALRTPMHIDNYETK